MPGFVETQTVLAAAQFDGTVGAGLFSFSRFDGMPLTTRVMLTTIAYAKSAAPAETVVAWLRRPGGLPTERIIVLNGTTLGIANAQGGTDIAALPVVVPREPNGQNWELVVNTQSKNADATVSVDFVLQLHPDGP